MELKLLKPLVRGGIVITAGNTIEVPDGKVEWFLKNNLAEKVQIILPSSDDTKPKSSRRKSRKNRN